MLISTETIPLEIGPDGVVHVSHTRVTLDTIVQAFSDGATADEIAQQYPSVPIADIYFVIGFYLRRFQEIEVYLQERRGLVDGIQQQVEARLNPAGTRARLLARQASRSA